MGKIRVKTIGIEEEEEKQKDQAKKRAEAKSAAKSKTEEKPIEESQPEQPKAQEVLEEEVKTQEVKKEPKKVASEHKQSHSKSYSTVAAIIDKSKTYSLPEALETLGKLQRAKFDETVELHITLLEKGFSGQVTLPHGTGKQTRVAIADDKLIEDIAAGNIEFDILVAEPAMMPKLAKVARILGPRGLMPNPKNGTVNPKPEEVAKKYAGGQISFKTESKAPVIHLTVGKMSFGDKKLEENVKSILKAIKKDQIVNITIKSTMSPGIRLVV